MIALIRSNLVFYWRTNLAVILGVAVAVAVLAGALTTGQSVRDSLRELALRRLANTQITVTGVQPFREELAKSMDGAPVLALEAIAQQQDSRLRAAKVQVFGVDERFWKLNEFVNKAPIGRQVLLSPALAKELAAKDGDSILLRVEKPSEVPRETLHGRREDSTKSMRFTFKGTAKEFSLAPRQGAILAAYVPLKRIQLELEQEGKANIILLGEQADAVKKLQNKFRLADVGLRTRAPGGCNCTQLESGSGLLTSKQVELAMAAASKLGLKAEPIFTYLINFTRAGSKQFPYSLITAIDLPKFAQAKTQNPPIVLTDWAASDLGAKTGDTISLEYFVWKQEGRLGTESEKAEVIAIVPLATGDRDMAPDFPGISDSDALSDWNPPFPMDLNKVRPVDEAFWNKNRTTPKMFVPLSVGQKWWGSRYGNVSAIRISPPNAAFEEALRASIDPLTMAMTVSPVRAQALAASAGSTDFGEYFGYFSGFLIIAALILAGLFFKLGVEQRLREIGLLRSLGYSMRNIRTLFLTEGFVLVTAGALPGALLSIGFAVIILFGLRTWWIGAVGTRELGLHVGVLSLAGGVFGGMFAGIFALWLALRKLPAATPKGLLGGRVDSVTPKRPGLLIAFASAFGAITLGLLGAAAAARIPASAGFFGGGICSLVSMLICFRLWLGSAKQFAVSGSGFAGLLRLGMRNASERPTRSVLSVTLIASATFLLISVDSFRHAPGTAKLDKTSGNGGFPLLAESAEPVYYNLDLPDARQSINLTAPELNQWHITSFRLKPGDEASCLNLYQPANPKVLGASEAFLKQGRFAFEAPAVTNPWLLLNEDLTNNAIPAAVDFNSMMYVLHKNLGDELTVNGVKLRLVAALKDSIFQGELIIAERHFLKAFPDSQGFSFFLLDGPQSQAARVTEILEDALSDSGFDASFTEEKLARFHAVENAYLSTFQALGMLGLLLGTVGLAAVLLRNVLERRHELALLKAVGFSPHQLGWVVFAENGLLLGAGLLTGLLSALLAVAPAFRGNAISIASMVSLLGLVLVTGLAAALLAMRAAIRSPLLQALRSE